ncbi:hypothetical protein [Flavobacterium sp.]|uniref:hypothetical protein n=1 Tax=Flavobacterium sp. TaxID=239 RepID=UPI0022CB8C52|nr:hypothetical protein [Flavobacterium sp.]MCZ8091240.1 hypothetical protein [Flavobacterium sp.]
MKKKILILFLFIFSSVSSQNYKITYLKSSNGNLIENQDAIWVFTNSNETLISSEKVMSKKSEFPFEQTFINRSNDFFQQMTNLNDEKSIATKDSLSLKKQNFEFTLETKKIH